MKRLLWVVVISLAVVAVGYVYWVRSGPTLSSQELRVREFSARAWLLEGTAADEEDIYEAIFRYRIAKYGFSTGPFFLTIKGEDPSDAFLARFADVNARIKKGSEADTDTNIVLRDLATGQRAVAFSVEEVRWSAPTLVAVLGGYYCGGLCADSGMFYLMKQKGRWEVLRFERHMIS